ncbi:MAG: SDR family oxidoreductase [Hyphomicrobiales bacterium]|nr:SDR family oxidoreductase [Hyphomicrobiales bacterium]
MNLNKPDILTGRTVLVTGAGGGIGGEIAVRLSQAGANIALHYNRAKPLETIEKIGLNSKKKVSFHAVQADFDEPDFALRLLDEVESKITTPDILINCAASQDVAGLKSMPDAEFDKMIKTNVSALFSLSNQFAKRLSDHQKTNASIINISSIEANRPSVGHAHYATSKAAVEMLTKSMALEYGPTGLRINAIAPGLIRRQGIETDWPQGVKSWNEKCPLKRMGTPDDIAQAVLFLASPASSFITGTILTIDGGMSVIPGW